MSWSGSMGPIASCLCMVLCIAVFMDSCCISRCSMLFFYRQASVPSLVWRIVTFVYVNELINSHSSNGAHTYICLLSSHHDHISRLTGQRATFFCIRTTNHRCCSRIMHVSFFWLYESISPGLNPLWFWVWTNCILHIFWQNMTSKYDKPPPWTFKALALAYLPCPLPDVGPCSHGQFYPGVCVLLTSEHSLAARSRFKHFSLPCTGRWRNPHSWQSWMDTLIGCGSADSTPTTTNFCSLRPQTPWCCFGPHSQQELLLRDPQKALHQDGKPHEQNPTLRKLLNSCIRT